MIVYTFHNGNRMEHHPSLKEARDAAIAVVNDTDLFSSVEEIEIERCEVHPLTKETFCEILNSHGGGWCSGSEVVRVVKRKHRNKAAA